MVDRTDSGVVRAVVILLPAGKVSTFVCIDTVRRVPVVIACSPWQVCKTVDFKIRYSGECGVRSQTYSTVHRNHLVILRRWAYKFCLHCNISILCLTTDVSTKVMRKKSVTSARSPRNTSAQPGDRYGVTSR